MCFLTTQTAVTHNIFRSNPNSGTDVIIVRHGSLRYAFGCCDEENDALRGMEFALVEAALDAGGAIADRPPPPLAAAAAAPPPAAGAADAGKEDDEEDDLYDATQSPYSGHLLVGWSHGNRPAVSATSTTAQDQISVRFPAYSLPAKISGAVYGGVPHFLSSLRVTPGKMVHVTFNITYTSTLIIQRLRVTPGSDWQKCTSKCACNVFTRMQRQSAGCRRRPWVRPSAFMPLPLCL